MSHAQIECWEGIDSRLLVVGSQTASLTPGPSFAHNLGCRCPNGQCEAIFDIYVSRPFQRHQEHPKCEVFCPLLSSSEHSGVPEDSKSQLFQVLGFIPTLGQSGVATLMINGIGGSILPLILDILMRSLELDLYLSCPLTFTSYFFILITSSN
jgi:hypothetical protein